MSRFAPRTRAFTLIELIIVMTIIAIVAAVAVPSLGIFSTSRQTNNAAAQMLEAAEYARAQAIAEGRTYRLNVDTSAMTYWLTADEGAGTFVAASGDHGQKYQLPSGVTLAAQITQQPNMLFNKTYNDESQETAVQSPQTLIDNEQLGTAGQVMVAAHNDGQYVEFQSTGRVDPATFTISDHFGKKIQLMSSTPSEMFHILAPGATR
jgi:prepilin-type N-terminal cleavage/methylation domain-containing protein